MPSLRLSRYVVASDPVEDKGHNVVRRVVFGTRQAATFLMNERTWRGLSEGVDQLPPEVVAPLVEAKVLVPKDEDELAAVITENRDQIAHGSDLYQVIQPTGWCQLDCGYCGQEHAVRYLSEPAQASTIASVKRRLDPRRYSRLQVGWFGAEPLVGLRVMRRMTPLLRKLAAEAGCEYGAKIVTNGLLLTPAIATELVEKHQVETAEITLDGTAEYHDARRIRKKTAGGSFDRIFANLLAVAAVPNLALKIIVRCNVDRFNAAGVSPLMHLLVAHGLEKRVSFYLAPIHSWGNDADQRAMTHNEFAERELDWLAEMVALGFNVGLLPSRKKVVCMAVQPDAELVDAAGDVFNCTEVSQVPFYGTPNVYSIGDVTSPNRRKNRLPTFNDEVLAGQYPCSSCPMLPVCGGACPKQWHEGRVPCPSAKHNIGGRLALYYAASRLSQGRSVAGPELSVGMH